MDQGALIDEMRELRENVSGVTDTAVAAVDGMLIAADTDGGMDANGLAALAAAGLGVARRTAAAAGRGPLRQTVTYCGRGFAAVYAVGDTALMLVLGDEGLNVNQLHLHTRPTLDRIGSILAGKGS